MPPVFRFAPSPTGLLHLGHALSAAAVWRAAETAGGRVLLRIEDIDPVRAKPEFAAAIEEDLAWLGFGWKGPVRRQSDHFADHAGAIDRLKARGLIYPCRLSRADIAAAVAGAQAHGRVVPRDPDGAPRLPLDRAVESDPDGPPAHRLDMNRALGAIGREPLGWTEQGAGPAGETGRVTARPDDWGDVVLARKDTPTSYHLAVVVDDAIQGVTHVVRGQDLFYATSIHRLLQRLLGLPEPRYRHHRLISGADGQKLAKTRGSPSLRSLREAGWTRQDVMRAIEPFLAT
ncbi:tRNA glutamyl-Q(34) synthetase GluQRS [Hansschlegelia plantiphila]|uniref:tRNA glutamyl-Q(34) synthetase GluQRS n=1 Tax=Hansschlegelia plantiphila TaxID=374655 RepID=A0A9W6IWJ3_9HYPH|nr:tRNA glutamyl-Q(34) synthetase GluQRS [Hansschlegelia plantiphila]GLK66450.1 tRNA glutamyl-Q(34) synthetase GluQRS [Hansschlegelia plantiphila]